MIILSSEQKLAIEAARRQNSNLIIEAVAGAGKTFTLIEILKILEGSIAFTAYNKDIATEISQRISPLNLDNVNVGTIHSMGFGSIRRAFKNVKVDGNKLNKLAKEEFNGEYEYLRDIAIKGAELAKQVMPKTFEDWHKMFDHYNLWDMVSEDAAIDAAQYLLNVSNSVKNVVDFSDMIYMPIQFNLRIWQYDVILLDEAQDTNRARRELIKKMLKPNGILIAVGDPHQAIYGFTGADHNSLNIIKEEFNSEVLRLSTTYRCPKKIVEYAQKWVGHIKAHESAPEGLLDFCKITDINPNPNDAIICRNTRPLIEIAYKLLRENISCKVEGRKIGEGLIKLINKWKSVKTVCQLEQKLDEWAEKEIQKNKDKEKFTVCQDIEDRVQTIKVFIEQCEETDGIAILIQKIKSLFEDNTSGCVILSTIHKAKGREWNHVYALGMNKYSPSKWAKMEWEIKQEKNLCYVQVTRSKHHLTIVEA
jgi:DNA helicase-2/ATP-dependent DNA helicase PcrA